MVERRGPGRPAFDSKQKLVAATCKLLSERGFEATSPVMIQQRSGVGQGSMYHHFPGKGKEGLALDAISHMRASTLAFLYGTPTPEGGEVEAVREHIVAALDRLFDRREGQALIRLMADGVAGAIKPLAQATQDWCGDIRAAIVVMLRADDPSEDPEVADAAAGFLAPEFEHLAEELFTPRDLTDNAAMESFFSLLQKNVLKCKTWGTRAELRSAIVAWIERTYHRRRRQARLGRLTPIEYETIMNRQVALAA